MSETYIKTPQAGEPIRASWGKGVVDALKAQQPQGGYGISINQNSNGTMISLSKKASKSISIMPFDVIPYSYAMMDETTANLGIVTCGQHSNVIFVINDSAEVIPIDDSIIEPDTNDEDPDESPNIVKLDSVELPTDTPIYIVVEFEYESGGMTNGLKYPEKYSFDYIDEDTMQDAMYDENYGLKYFPIAMLTKIEAGEKAVNYGAYKHVFSINHEDSDAVEYYKLTQLHHGDIVVSQFSEGTKIMEWTGSNPETGNVIQIYGGGTSLTRVMEVTSIQNGVFVGNIIDDNGDPEVTNTVATMTDISLMSTVPIGTRLLVHGLPSKYLGGR